MPVLKKINPDDITDNAFRLIGKDWMLITSGGMDSFNTMTASWGGIGELWHKNVSFIFVRPSRYTYEFLERNRVYTLSFFGEEHRNALSLCGSKSGRDIDKAGEAGLTAVQSENGSVYFSEARLVIECAKLYYQDLDPSNFLDGSIEKNYSGENYHRMYIGEVLSVLRK